MIIQVYRHPDLFGKLGSWEEPWMTHASAAAIRGSDQSTMQHQLLYAAGYSERSEMTRHQ